MLLDDYAGIITRAVSQIQSTQRDKITAAAGIISESLLRDGLVHVFGCGHSHMLAEETFYRAGGVVPVSPVFYEPLMLHQSASGSSVLEKQEGLAEEIFSKQNFNTNDVLICVSTSGINAVPVEFAERAVEFGIPVIGISSDEYLTHAPANRLGLHLQQVCSVCINNFAPYGDACLGQELLGKKIIPVSTITSTFIINSILAETAALAAARGFEVPTYVSGNVPGGAEKNKEYISKYKPRIKCL